MKLATGKTHDIDELSSGEKEILYGYLRIRNTTPNNSILLIDEPELHLNPRLIRGLPQFYKKYLGSDMGNQIFLVTHSDAFLRETVGQNGFSVFHMQAIEDETKAANQLTELKFNNELDNAIKDLIGDLATYLPGGKVVIFEGGGESKFDVTMTSQLFPKFQNSVNLISGEHKIQVKKLHGILEQLPKNAKLSYKFFSIRDSDNDSVVDLKENEFKWNVYHIENYLLQEKYILETIKELMLEGKDTWTEDKVRSELKKSAEESVNELVKEELQKWADSTLIKK